MMMSSATPQSVDQDPPLERQQTRKALSPWAMPFAAWKAIGLRAVKETSTDNVGLVAAGVAFYGFLALVPLLGALVLIYGLLADGQTVLENIRTLMQVMPADAARLIGEQLMDIVRTSDGKKGLGLLLAIALALFGARNGAGSIITAVNIAYEEEEKRSFIRVNLLALAITAISVGVAIIAALSITLLGQVEALVPGLPTFVLTAGRLLSYLLLVLAGAAGAATLYRYAPSRTKAKWVWITPGSLLAAILWLCLTLGFGLYVANFGNYDATYGSLGAVVVLLTWLYLSSYVLIFGAELNSEFERATARDTTEGADKPAGLRGAAVADEMPDRHSATSPSPLADHLDKNETADPVGDTEPGLGKRLAVARATARASQAAGWGYIGLIGSSLSTVGLGLIRKQGGPAKGLALVAGAVALAWFTREGSSSQSPE